MLESLFEISVQEGRLAHTGVSHQEHFEGPGILGHFDMDIHLFARE
jgi:hypothetical protein